MSALLFSGCALWPHHDKKPPGILRVHVESETSSAGSTKTISILRSKPVLVNISLEPILTEADVTGAKIIGPDGAFDVQITFKDTAGWQLEQYSATNPGKHLVIFGQWGDKPADGRWLAAPLIHRRMAGGVLTFTPDATHEEMETWVKGLDAHARANAPAKEKD